MNSFQYGDEQVRDRDIMVAIPSMVIAVGILTLPRNMAQVTVAVDGWVSIVISGGIVIVFTWMAAKLSSLFPGQSFFTYASNLVTKPIAVMLTFLLLLQGLLITAFEIRAVADISHQYLFDKTPIEVVALTILLVIIYAVSGSRAGIFRLNSLFLPMIFLVSLVIILVSIAYFKIAHILPVFKTDINGLWEGIKKSSFSYTGFGILLFYIPYVKSPRKTPLKAVTGMSWAIVLYVLLYFTCIAVFGDVATANINFPTIELARAVELPGGFFVRFESIFFVIWIMAVFTTAVMAFDASLIALQSLFKGIRKFTAILIYSPIIYLISTIPENFLEVRKLSEFISYYEIALVVPVTVLLLTIAKVKGEKNSGR